jgi:hypothetical protein
MRGDQQQARSLHEESLKLSLELGDKLIAAESLEGLACSAARGEEERAARLFGAAETLREAVAYNQAPRERALREPFLGAARSRLEEATWEAAWAQGRAMTFEDAIAYALKRYAKGSILLHSAHFSTLRPTASAFSTLRPTASASQHVAWGFAGRLLSISAVCRRAAGSIISRSAVVRLRARQALLPLAVASLAGLAVFGDDELGELFY